MALRLLLVGAIDNKLPIDGHHPLLGLGYIVSSLRQRFGNLVDCRIINKNLTENIKEFQPDIVGITSVSKNYDVAKGYAAIAKGFNLPVIIGGVHVSFMPQTFTRDMDIGIIGEGERTIVELIESFLEEGSYFKGNLYDIDGIIFWDQGQLIKTEPRGLIRPLDDIPYPARDLLKIDKSAHMLSSRGCPYHCAFCSTAKSTGNEVRYASAEYVAEEIESIYKKYRVEYLTLYDDLFAMNSKRVIKIQELLAAKNLIGKIDFAVNIRSDFVTDELAEVLRQMNVKTVGLGTESGCQKTLDYLKCGSLKVEDNANAVRILKKHHIIPYCSFIIGAPQESKEDILETIQFIKDNGIHHYAISVLTPFPGTVVWEDALAQGKVSDDMDWGKLSFYLSSDPVIIAEKLSRQEIIEICDQMAIRERRNLIKRKIKAVIKHPDKYIKLLLRSKEGAL